MNSRAIEKIILLVAAATLALLACFATLADAQTFDETHVSTLTLAGNGADITHTLTLQAPALGSSYTLTFPSASSNGVLTNTAGVLSWGSAILNPMTGPGDMIYGGVAGAATRLAATATANQILLSGANAAPSWSTATYPATSGSAGNYLRSDGTNFVSTIIQAGDVPTLNQNTTGSAAKLTTARTIAGNSFDGSANITFSNKFIVQGTSDAGLTGAQFLGSLATGLVKNTTATGVLNIASAGTDYSAGTSGLSTGILKSTTGTGALTIAVAGDFPTLNQNTTGTAANATNIATTSVSNSANYYPLFVASSANGNQAPDLGTGLTFNPSTNTLTTTAQTLGAVSATTGSLSLANSSSANLTTIQAGNATAAVTYVLPTAQPSANAILQVNSVTGTGPYTANLGWGAATGTVTSVGLSMPSIMTVSNSPVTTSGTLTATLATQSANTVFAGPSSGSSATPTFRTLTGADLAAASGSAGSVAVLSRNSSDLTTSSASLTNATGLSFNIAAGETWSVDFELSCNAASAGGMAFGITIPSGATIEANAMGVRASVNNYQCDRITTSGTATLIQYAKASDGPVRITGLVVNGSTAGTIQLQFLSGTGGTNVTIYKNSYGLANRF